MKILEISRTSELCFLSTAKVYQTEETLFGNKLVL